MSTPREKRLSASQKFGGGGPPSHHQADTLRHSAPTLSFHTGSSLSSAFSIRSLARSACVVAVVRAALQPPRRRGR